MYHESRRRYFIARLDVSSSLLLTPNLAAIISMGVSCTGAVKKLIKINNIDLSKTNLKIILLDRNLIVCQM
jgi:hypothetical protein